MKMKQLFSKLISALTPKKHVDNSEEYILWVTTFDGEGYSSRWYGWNRELTFNYKEACKKKEELSSQYFDIEIINKNDMTIDIEK